MSESFARLAALERERRSFALATVVARRTPVSSHLGDRALVFSDGTIEGFVGGSCSREIVRREALRTLRTGLPRLVQIRPEAGESPNASRECVVVAMGCASEGAVDVYIEPHLPSPRLIVAGDTPVAEALARVAAQIGYEVARVVLAAELGALAPIAGVRAIALEGLAEELSGLRVARRDDELVAVVASQGHYDEAALTPLLAAEPAFIGLLASARRARAVLEVLAAEGVAAERLALVRAPVGLDIGARSPGDVAISILAEIIAKHREPATSPSQYALDPVCGMEVPIAGARYTFDHQGVRSYFCCASCRQTYAAQREQVPTAGGTA